jgi:methylglutaconyl-CoA hydratase
MMSVSVTKRIDSRGIATVTLDRPDRHNAFDDMLIAELTRVIAACGDDPAIRAVVLTGAGKSFSAGADLGWMQRCAGYSQDANLADAAALARLMQTLDRLPKPTIAAVNGPAYGGGVGLVACCDIAIAADSARFCLSEVKLGLIPAVISPYVVAAIGARQARRYFVTAEVFSSAKALELGLVHEVATPDGLEAAVERIVSALLQGGPKAQADAKDLVFTVDRPLDEALISETARRIAQRRASDEGREGLAAFLDRREPSWRPAEVE